jgi:LacI family transcriptional regulator
LPPNFYEWIDPLSRRPSLRDIAAIAEVSLSTVSLVLNDRPGISGQTRSRVRDAAAQLGYEMSLSTAAPSSTNAIGLLIEQGSMHALLDIFYGDVIRGFQTEAQRLGYQVLLHMYDRETEGLDTLRADLAEQVSGLIVANDGDITPQMVVQLEDAAIPLVLIENHVEGHRLPSILGDNFTAGYTVTRHLLSLGHSEIAVLRGPAKYSSLVDRLRGCLAALAEAGLALPERVLADENDPRSTPQTDGGRRHQRPHRLWGDQRRPRGGPGDPPGPGAGQHRQCGGQRLHLSCAHHLPHSQT